MVGVGGVEAADDPLLDVVAVVAIGVFEIEHVRPLGDDHALPPELKAGWVVEVIGKSLHAIGAAVAVGVFQNQQLVVHRLVGTPVRIGRPDGHPQPARGVEGHLHRVDQLGKHRFVGHQLHPHARVDGHLADRLVAGEEGMLAACELTGLVGLHVDQVRQADLVDRGERGLGVAQRGRGCPDATVAVGRLHVEVFQLALHDLVVGLAADKPQPGPAAVGGEAVGHTVAVEPVEVLVGDGQLQPSQRLLAPLRMPAEEGLVDDAGDHAVAGGVGMDAIHGQRLGLALVGLERGPHEIDTGHTLRAADLLHGGGVETDVLVVGRAVWVVTLGVVFGTEMLVADRCEEHQPRGRDAVVGLTESVIDEGGEVGLEGVEALGAGMGLIATEEGEDHIGGRANELEAVLANNGWISNLAWPGDRGGAGEPLIGGAEVGAPQPLGRIDLIAVDGQVADREAALGKAALQHHLQPAGVLHRVGNATADDADVVAFFDHQLGSRAHGRRQQEEDCQQGGDPPIVRPANRHLRPTPAHQLHLLRLSADPPQRPPISTPCET